ncbi:HD domain-containing protein [Ammonicoccus fulvus]|uniref:HD domain-containing protein n=1 Tax=Ammonicoccus fulvus TaxID=3138240 RepID=A0ABZ3FU42_9ACTN
MDLRRVTPDQITADEFCDLLFGLWSDRGNERYDEVVSQSEHALQCAALAEADGAGPELQIAALLHDVAHLWESEEEFRDTDLVHEVVGARWLTEWFGNAVAAPVALHVAAKRYLVAVEPEYADTLSPASVHSLKLQGGPMNQEEVARFEANKHHADAVRLRRWDDLAKDPEATTSGFEHYREPIRACLTLAPR